ncbi:MAG: nuclease family protein [Conexibacter sp.]|nr:nuclease family protein [Conexibacter sp.]
MDLNDLFGKHCIDSAGVLVLRHVPQEPKLRRTLPWLAAERPELFNAYQQSQFPKLEKAFTGAKHVASFIGVDVGTAVFVGLYGVKGWRVLGSGGFWEIGANKELQQSFGMRGLGGDRPATLWFDLERSADFYANWHGRLVIRWPGLERSWWRWANRNTFTIAAIRDSTAFEQPMPSWDELVVSWPELNVLPLAWRSSLREWRGIYLISDSSDGRGYVGAAYGAENILGRWLEYGASGHGGNKLLRERNANNFQFSILQRVSPDMPSDEVIRLEQSWKNRLHTREFGLNEN